MAVKAVLFDLDGTLLPMDQDYFLKVYLKRLTAKMEKHGYDPDLFMKALWHGIKAMVMNDGVRLNEEVFWDAACQISGERLRADEPLIVEFYETEFDSISEVCGFNAKSAETVRELKRRGCRITLATNPVFPAIATNRRIKWAGLTTEDFEIITTYENIGFCKPNPNYFLDLAQRMQVKPEECVMVGNDVGDDMAALKAGMKAFLLTDCMINRDNEDISKYPHGSFDELMAYIESL